MPLPNFFVIGAPKCGTTALYGALIQHPEIYMPVVKEPHYFSHHPARPAPEPSPHVLHRLRERVTDPLEYYALFSAASGQRAIGEASTSYLISRVAARRIHHNLPDAKLVAILRDPVERAYSSYWYYVVSGRERAPSFEHALARGSARPDEPRAIRHFRQGLYHAHLSAYFERFPREQIRVYLYEDWRDSPRELLHDLFAFLGVNPDVTPALEAYNVTRLPRSRRLQRLARSGWLPGLARLNRRHNLQPPPPMRDDTRRRLRAAYREDIEQLATLIDRDLSHWLEPRAVEDSRALA